MKRETKEDLKQDEVRSIFEHGVEWLVKHRDEARIGGVVVIVLAAGIGALSYFQSNRAKEATGALEQAMSTWAAPVAAVAPGAEKPTGLTFGTSEAKYKASLQEFEGVERRFGSRLEGRRAAYYVALCQVELGMHAEAEKGLVALKSQRAGLESDLAQLALAGLYRKMGQTEKAIELFRQISTDPQARVPRDAALAGLAATFEDAKKPAEALASYKQLVEEYPSSPYASDARRRSEYLATAVKS